MLQSPLLPEQHSSIYFDHSNNNFWAFRRSKSMANGSPKDGTHGRSPAATYVAPPTTILGDPSSAAAHLKFVPASPHSYSHSPPGLPTAAGGVPSGDAAATAAVHPWIFTLFPDPYADTQAYPTTVDNQYVHGVGDLVYRQATEPHSPARPSHGAHPTHTFDTRIHGDVESHPTDGAFSQPYDGTGTLHDFERYGRQKLPSQCSSISTLSVPSPTAKRENPRTRTMTHYNVNRVPKRTRLPPFSEYDSSSSECDPRDWSTHSDYSRSPQLGSHSCGGSTAHSSPNIGAHSPDPNAGEHVLRSNPAGYTHGHLVAEFPGPLRTKTRKVRRKLEPREREQVHQLRKIGACTKCWGLKMKCDDGSPCKRCEKTGTGALCVRVHFVDLDVFSKWLVDSYSRTMMHHTLRFTNAPPRTLVVSHKTLDVTVQLNVYEFAPSATEELDYWYKDASGWQSIPTAPFAMKRGINTDIMEKYIQDHTYYFIESAFRENSIMTEIFTAVFKYSSTEGNFLLRDTLQLWTATQMLIKGATLHPTSDSLGIMPIPSPSSPQAGKTPLPRVLSNQIDHLLERRIWQLEKQILCELQKRIFGRKREDWLKIFFTTVVFLNALERDSWRLYYWLFHMKDGYVWRHPTTPKRLLEKNDVLATSLSAHFAAISKGLTPFALDWSRGQTIGLIGNCEDPEGIMGAIERIGRGLRNPDHALFTSNILSHYRQDDERSLDFLYSSKVMIV